MSAGPGAPAASPASPSGSAPASRGRVRAILGPTGAGKSALALAVAEAASARGEPHEIVAIDAFTVYRGMDVGTAKPTPTERARVPHHLIDVLDPADELTVVRFRDLARAAIADVHARGATALLVGGSGLYWRAVVDGLEFPPTDPEVRAAVADRLGDDAEAAHAELAARDPAAAERIPVRNLRRVVRALEVLELTGRPFSSWDDAWGRYESVHADLDVALLDPPDDVLRASIAARAAAMVAGGLVAEERRLAAAPRSRTAAAGIGYAEAAAVLRGELAEDDLAAAVAARTWRYARRQRAWFRADPRCTPTEPADVLGRWGGRG
ncbi:MAG: tRNA ((37)-N6)-dimethylallyltransferase MiaA [Actinomycetota bacterium]